MRGEELIIDAGEGDTLYRVLRWRYGCFAKIFASDSAIITRLRDAG